jgi:hypothetical protein
VWSRQTGHRRGRRPNGITRVDVVFRLWQCDKDNHGWREGPPLTVPTKASICWPGLNSPAKSISNEKIILLSLGGRQPLIQEIGRYSGKFCTVGGMPVNKGLRMLQMSSAKWKGQSGSPQPYTGLRPCCKTQSQKSADFSASCFLTALVPQSHIAV